MRLLHLSDIHFGCEQQAPVRAAAEFAHAGGFDLIVLTGDITQFGAPSEFAAAAAWLAELPQPRLSTPGNHDTPYLGLAERIAAPFARYAAAIGPQSVDAFDAPGLRVRSFNTARGVQLRANWSKGAVGLGQARAAARAFAAAPPGALRVLACHHPLMEMLGAPMTGRVHGGRRAAHILAHAKADLILTGHVHVPFAMRLPLGDERTYAVGAGTLSQRERGAPAGFNVIEWDAETINVIAMSWTGSHFEPSRTWGTPRRAAD